MISPEKNLHLSTAYAPNGSKMGLESEYHVKRTEESDAEAADHLRECVLSQRHASRAHDSGHEDDEAEPPDGVERPFDGVGHERAGEASDGSAVGRDFPPHVDDGADDLDGQCREQDAADDVWNVERGHRVVAREIADDADDVGHHEAFLGSHFVGVPALCAAVESDEQRGQQNGEDVGLQEHENLERPGHDFQVAEQKQGCHTHQRQVERSKNRAHGLGQYH